MNSGVVSLLGAIAGFTIFLGLPIARLRGLKPSVQGFLNALATGVLVFLLVDILKNAGGIVEEGVHHLHHGDVAGFAGPLLVYVAGLAIGLVGLAWFTRHLARWVRRHELRGPGAAVATPTATAIPARYLALTIATGLGMHNFSEGLAIGQSAATGALAFTGVLLVGFGLHNITEGFGVAAPMASVGDRPRWGFLALAGLVGGGPTFIGTVVGYRFVSPLASVLFLTLAAGALIYVINEMLSVGRRLNGPVQLAAGILIGFLAGLGTDLFLIFAGG